VLLTPGFASHHCCDGEFRFVVRQAASLWRCDGTLRALAMIAAISCRTHLPPNVVLREFFNTWSVDYVGGLLCSRVS
jgi:hypothetical protein